MAFWDKSARARGFESAKEMRKLVIKVPLTTEIDRRYFAYWKEHDGTKAGLLSLLDPHSGDALEGMGIGMRT